MYTVKFTEILDDVYTKLPPEIKTEAKKSLKTIAANPLSGKPLQDELFSYYTFRFMRYRIVYKIDGKLKRIVVHGIGHRSTIYEYMTKLVREGESSS